jgi:hypothetical protein
MNYHVTHSLFDSHFGVFHGAGEWTWCA